MEEKHAGATAPFVSGLKDEYPQTVDAVAEARADAGGLHVLIQRPDVGIGRLAPSKARSDPGHGSRQRQWRGG